MKSASPFRKELLAHIVTLWIIGLYLMVIYFLEAARAVPAWLQVFHQYSPPIVIFPLIVYPVRLWYLYRKEEKEREEPLKTKGDPQ